jgi:ABC-2 type transport system ATP-binding protein
VRGLRKSYRGRVAAAGIDLDARAGEVTAILGPNGAGKTTTVECCAGLRRADSGSIRVLGLDRADASKAAALRRLVGVMLQDVGLPMAPRAGDVLSHVASMYDAPMPPGPLLERLDLTGSARTPVRRLSGGQRQRLALACAVVGRPRLVFLDEPSYGLDPRSRIQTWDLVRELRADGVAIILTTHLMAEAEELADTVSIVDAGVVVASGTPSELAGHAVVDVRPARGDPPAQEWSRRVRSALAEAGRGDLAGRTSVRHDDGAARVLVPAGTLGPGARDVADVAAAAEAAAGGAGAEITAGGRTLEDVFLEITGRTLAAADEAANPRRRRAS